MAGAAAAMAGACRSGRGMSLRVRTASERQQGRGAERLSSHARKPREEAGQGQQARRSTSTAAVVCLHCSFYVLSSQCLPVLTLSCTRPIL